MQTWTSLFPANGAKYPRGMKLQSFSAFCCQQNNSILCLFFSLSLSHHTYFLIPFLLHTSSQENSASLCFLILTKAINWAKYCHWTCSVKRRLSSRSLIGSAPAMGFCAPEKAWLRLRQHTTRLNRAKTCTRGKKRNELVFFLLK